MQLEQDFSLLAYNTFGIAAKSDFFVSADTASELKEATTDAKLKDLPKLFLGGGSNLLFTKDFPGVVIKVSFSGKEVISESDSEVVIKVAAGENWHEFVEYAVNAGYAGLENLALIPGNVGAAPIQNIGAYGTEVKAVITSVEVFDIPSGEIKNIENGACKFGYRDSIFKRELKGKVVVTAVYFKLQKSTVAANTSYKALSDYFAAAPKDSYTTKEVFNAVCAIRSSKLPDLSLLGTAGSFFKNPFISADKFAQLQQQYPNIPSYPEGDIIKVPAGWLIEQCGWKGHRVNDAGVYEKQALVLVNYGKSSGAEILSLANQIISSVQDKFDITLEPEVNII